jgi:hypothetical protein
VDTALAYGYKAILYFTYWTPGDPFNNAIIDGNGKRTEHFNQVKRINGELKVLGSTLMKLTSTGVYHTGEIPAGCKALDPGLPIKIVGEPVHPDLSGLVLGMFKHDDGSTWVIVVNRHLRNNTTARLTFAGKIQEMSPKTGVMRDLKLEDGSVSLDLRPGEAKLLKLI